MDQSTGVISKLFNSGSVQKFYGFAENAYQKVPEIRIDKLMFWPEEQQSVFTKELLEDDLSSGSVNKGLRILRDGFQAYLQFQDIFEITLQLDEPIKGRHYCFFESIIYLREAIIGLLSNRILSCMTLTRPLIELAHLHIYWRAMNDEREYKRYYEWLKGEKHRSKFDSIINEVFNRIPAREYVNLRRIKAVKSRIHSAYLKSCSYNHSPRLNESVVFQGNGMQQNSESLFLYALDHLNEIVRHLVILYIFAYPVSLFPVNRAIKWGFGGPLGFFSDHSNYNVIKRFVGEDEIENLSSQLSDCPEVIDLLDWYGDFPDLSDEQIESDWQRLRNENPSIKEVKELVTRLVLEKAHLRSIRWMMGYSSPRAEQNRADFSD